MKGRSDTAIVLSADFDAAWPFAGDHLRGLWEEQGAVCFHRLPSATTPVGDILDEPSVVRRLAAFEVPLTLTCLEGLSGLEEATVEPLADEVRLAMQAKGVRLIEQRSEGYWGQSVGEYALGLTIAALRRIPQLHRRILSDLTPWDYSPPAGQGQPGLRGAQYGDTSEYTSGTVSGKRVRIVGAGNIGSRYASFCRFLGADVAAWDPFAPESAFHRSGARQEHHLDRLMADAEIFAPMLPLQPDTEGIVAAKQIDALPPGALVVLVTRAGICDMKAIRRRVLASELALAADVFDSEPLSLDDPLLGRDNVVHTPHNAGRTRHANQQIFESSP